MVAVVLYANILGLDEWIGLLIVYKFCFGQLRSICSVLAKHDVFDIAHFMSSYVVTDGGIFPAIQRGGTRTRAFLSPRPSRSC